MMGVLVFFGVCAVLSALDGFCNPDPEGFYYEGEYYPPDGHFR